MVIQVLASIFDDVGYYYNLGYLQRALQDDQVAFIGVNIHTPEAFVFDNKARIYDFTRSAKATIRDDMTKFLNQPDVLPGLQAEDQQMIKEPFEFLFNNLTGYTRSLNQVFLRRIESMNMLILNEANGDHNQQYVAHVSLTCNTRRAAEQQYTVDASLTCQRFTYFPLQEDDFDAVLQALQNLHVPDE